MKLQVQLGAIAILQLSAALALQLIVLVIVGPGRETDAFIAAQAVPLVLFSVVAISLQSVWQPRLAVLAANASTLLGAQRAAQAQLLVVYGGTSLLAAATCAQWLPWLFASFTSEQISFAVGLSQIFFTAGVFSGHALLYGAAMRARQRFVQADLAGLVWSLLFTVLAAVLVPYYGVAAAAWASLARAIATTATLYWVSGRALPSLQLGWENGLVWQRLRPLLAGSSLYKTSPLVDRYLASQSGPGGLTVYNLALLAVGAVATVLERALVGPFSVRAATLIQARDVAALRVLYRRIILQITTVTAAIGTLIVALYPVWKVNISGFLGIPEALSVELWFVSMLILGYLHVSASGAVCVAIFYAHGNTRTPVAIGMIGFALGLIFKTLGFLLAGLPGLAAGTSAMFIINLALFSLALRRYRYLG